MKCVSVLILLCAWVLWRGMWDMDQKNPQYPDVLHAVGGFETAAFCQDALTKLSSKTVYFVCLPDAVDPRPRK